MTVAFGDRGLACSAGPARRRVRGGLALATLAPGLLLAACAPIPNLGPRPQPLTAAQVQADKSLPGTPGAVWPGDDWWKGWGDPQLDALIAEGLANSPDVATALARFRRAGAMAEQAGAARLPRADLQGNAGLERQSLNMGFPPQFQAFLPQGWNDGGQVALNVGFDPDLWGRNRAAYAAARSEQQAAALEARQARLALTVGIASAYVDLDRLYAERDVRQRQLESSTQIVKLTSERQANGLENRGGVALTAADLSTARVNLAAAEQALALRRNQISALIGAGPDRGLALARPRLAPPQARPLPEAVTTELVSRRADVIAARSRVEAAASRIGVARADFFPSIRLGALIGFQSLGLDLLFNKNSMMGTVGPAISLPIFHGGELQGRYRGARADYDEAVAGYNRTVLMAYQQTADAVTSSQLAARQLGEARAGESAAREARDLMQARYKGGLATAIDVLIADDRLLRARLSVIALEDALRNADVATVRALGGGVPLAMSGPAGGGGGAMPAASPMPSSNPSSSAQNSKDPVHG